MEDEAKVYRIPSVAWQLAFIDCLYADADTEPPVS